MAEYRTSVKGLPTLPLKGRGVAWYVPGRFEPLNRAVFDDGWGTGQAGDDEGCSVPTAGVKTWVKHEAAQSVLVANDSPDIDFDLSVNPYRGCEHGCVYCYARPSHSYLDLSPGLDFETRIIAKTNVVEVLRTELQKPSYVPRPINIGSNTDCYQPIERSLELTRGVMGLLAQAHHAFSVITKSSGIERDIDLIAPMAAHQRAAAYVTITSLDPALCRILEPRASSPLRRLRTIKTLAEAGIPVGVSVAPQIPFINDDMEQVLEAAREAGASRAFYTVLRLPWELDGMFQDWLRLHYPMRAQRVMARIAEMRGGRSYDSNFATRMKGSGVWAELIAQRFHKACHRLGYQHERHALDMTGFDRGALTGQRRLF